jgi:hypothetical protein
MTATALTPEHRAAAPALGAALRVLLAGLATLVARGLLRHPLHAAIIVPLWTRLNRTATRFDRLMARIAAGTERPRPSRPRPGRAAGKPPIRLPSRRAWLLEALKHEAAHYTQRIEHLLADPATAALIAATPQARSLLRPLCQMLGVRHASLGVNHPAIPRRRARPKPPSPAFAALGREADQGRGPSRGDGKGEGRASTRAIPPAWPPPAPPATASTQDLPCHHRQLWPFPNGRGF